MKSADTYLFFLFICLILGACTQQELASPSCRIDASNIATHSGKGACVVVIGGNLMVNELKNDKLRLSVGSEQATQSAQCSAHQAIFNDTGFNVEVAEPLSIQKDGIWLFSCSLDAGYDGSESAFEPAITLSGDLKQIRFIDPFNVEKDQWQNPDYLISVRDAYVNEIRKQTK